jgi:hypothetical protein
MSPSLVWNSTWPHESVIGTSRHFTATQQFGRFRRKAEIRLSCAYKTRL